MKRKGTSIKIEAPKDSIEAVLRDVPGFVTNWPYVVRISMRDGLKAEIMMPRFVFRFRDTYRVEYHSDYNSHIYDGTGDRGHLTLVITLKEWQKYVDVVLELSYKGKGEFWLGKTLQDFVEKVGKAVKELAESRPIKAPEPTATSSDDGIAAGVDFSNPMSVAEFLSKSQMVHSGLHVISAEGLLGLIGELRGNIRSNVLYISGITNDGTRSFKVLLNGSRVLAIEFRDKNGTEVIKVEDDEDAGKALELTKKVQGAYMVNVWVPVGGV